MSTPPPGICEIRSWRGSVTITALRHVRYNHLQVFVAHSRIPKFMPHQDLESLSERWRIVAARVDRITVLPRV